MNPDSANTRIIPGRKPSTDPDAITLSLDLPRRLEDAPTIGHSAPASGAPTGPAQPATAGVRYVIVGEAGRGGMATVHVARDIELLRKVAIKELSAELRGANSARLRFLREVQVTAQLDHPYIVPVYGLEVTPQGSPAYAMKLVTGRTLFDYLKDTFDAYASGGRPDEAHSLPARIEQLLKVCEAVDYAHGKGVIHRDLKPANIMLGEHGETYLMDWGICRLFGSDDPDFTGGIGLSDASGGAQTEYGTVVGTPRYMSPEQALWRSPCAYGGTRPWFACPRCKRCVAIVYLGNVTGCRRCLRLRYPSQSDDSLGRSWRRTSRILRKLGRDADDTPKRPSGMRRRTYERLCDAWWREEEFRDEALTAFMAERHHLFL